MLISYRLGFIAIFGTSHVDSSLSEIWEIIVVYFSKYSVRDSVCHDLYVNPCEASYFTQINKFYSDIRSSEERDRLEV